MFGSKPQVHRQADLQMFTIYDSKTESYGSPQFAINAHDLIRQVINMFEEPKEARNKYLINAEDYSIFRLGDYCFKTGTITAVNPTHVVNMHELRTIAQNKPKEDFGYQIPKSQKALGPT